MYIQTLRHIVTRSAFTRSFQPFSVRFQSTKSSKPLRILFCGSDEFSCASLRALHEEQQRDPKGIASINVLCRPGKPSGRNLKIIKEAPIKAVAEELGLQLHERDTFTGWEPPRPSNKPINLIIAVSFGLFVPPRILKGAKYGGLNVHPSLLPNFRGPAPLQHTIMRNSKSTGVTLQTLDAKSFDHGIILAQTPQKDSSVPDIEHITYERLLSHVTPMAADILVQGIRDRVFVPPLTDAGWYSRVSKKIHHAPKVTAEDKQINWGEWEALRIERYSRALGRLWTRVCTDAYNDKRFIFEDAEAVRVPKAIQRWFDAQNGKTFIEEPVEQDEQTVRFMVFKDLRNEQWAHLFIEDDDAIIISSFEKLTRESEIATQGRMAIRVKEITVEGLGRKSARKAMENIKEREEWTLKKNGSKQTLGVEVRGPKINRKEVARETAVRLVGLTKAKIKAIHQGYGTG